MELQQLELQNFRQFKEDKIEFARERRKGITVIHGSNGSGKTTLLNAFTWLFYDEVDFETRPDRLITEGTIAEATAGDQLTVAVQLQFEHEGVDYITARRAIFEKRSNQDLDGELIDMEITLKYKQGTSWRERGNPENSLDQILPERLSDLFFFDGEDIEELAGINNQERIQESIQNIMGLTILERSTRHLEDAADRFEDEVEELASDELAKLIEQKREIEETVAELERKRDDTERSIDRIKTEVRDIEQKLERLDESAALQERRQEYREEREKLEARVEKINKEIKAEIDERGFVPLAMPLINQTAERLDKMRKDGVIPSDLNNSYIDSLLDAERCICGRPLESGTKHYNQVAAMKGQAVEEGVEQSAIRIIGHINQMSDMESAFFDNIEEYIGERKRLRDDIRDRTEKIDEIGSELQKMDQTTASGESIPELEAKRETKEGEREELIGEKGRIEEKIDQNKEKIKSLKEDIEEQRDEREEALVARRRQKAAELVAEDLKTAFSKLKDKVRKLSNEKIQDTFGSIASKDLLAEITKDFELKIWQDVGGERVEVDKSTGERQIASLAFIGSLVDIARERYEADPDSEYFTGGIYPLVMDSPFGALDKSHRRQVSRVIPELANQIVVFATDSQWEGPVEDEMSPKVGKQYWLDFDEGNDSGSYPRTRIKTEPVNGD